MWAKWGACSQSFKAAYFFVRQVQRKTSPQRNREDLFYVCVWDVLTWFPLSERLWKKKKKNLHKINQSGLLVHYYILVSAQDVWRGEYLFLTSQKPDLYLKPFNSWPEPEQHKHIGVWTTTSAQMHPSVIVLGHWRHNSSNLCLRLVYLLW